LALSTFDFRLGCFGDFGDSGDSGDFDDFDDFDDFGDFGSGKCSVDRSDSPGGDPFKEGLSDPNGRDGFGGPIGSMVQEGLMLVQTVLVVQIVSVASMFQKYSTILVNLMIPWSDVKVQIVLMVTMVRTVFLNSQILICLRRFALFLPEMDGETRRRFSTFHSRSSFVVGT
jgi:hypothetical protein